MDASFPGLMAFNPLGRQREHILEGPGSVGAVWHHGDPTPGLMLGQVGQCTGVDCTPAPKDSE